MTGSRSRKRCILFHVRFVVGIFMDVAVVISYSNRDISSSFYSQCVCHVCGAPRHFCQCKMFGWWMRNIITWSLGRAWSRCRSPYHTTAHTPSSSAASAAAWPNERCAHMKISKTKTMFRRRRCVLRVRRAVSVRCNGALGELRFVCANHKGDGVRSCNLSLFCHFIVSCFIFQHFLSASARASCNDDDDDDDVVATQWLCYYYIFSRAPDLLYQQFFSSFVGALSLSISLIFIHLHFSCTRHELLLLLQTVAAFVFASLFVLLL